MKRLPPEIEVSNRQLLLEVIIVVLSAVLMVGTAWAYSSLPERIPMHFGASGLADRWGSKGEVWVLPAVYMLLAITLRWLNGHPHWYNYSVPVTEANARQIYRMGACFMRAIRLWVAVIFCLAQASIIDAAFRQGSTPVIWLIWAAIAGLLVTTVWGVYRFHVSAPK